MEGDIQVQTKNYMLESDNTLCQVKLFACTSLCQIETKPQRGLCVLCPALFSFFLSFFGKASFHCLPADLKQDNQRIVCLKKHTSYYGAVSLLLRLA